MQASTKDIDFPPQDKSVLGDIRNNRVELYKHMWPLNLSHHTLAFIGGVQPLGAIFPIAELQARLAARVFKVRQTNVLDKAAGLFCLRYLLADTKQELKELEADEITQHSIS